MRTPIAVLAVVVASLVVGSPLAAGAGAPTSAPGTHALVLLTDAVSIPAGSVVRAVSPATALEVSLTLAYPNPGGLERYLAAVEDPGSPLYRQYLTSAQFEATFAPPSANVAAVVAALSGAGARSVTVAPDRGSVLAQLPAAGVDSLLGVQLVDYASVGATELYTAEGVPTLPASLAGVVSGVSGLSNAADLRFTYELGASPLEKVLPTAGSNEFVVNNSTGSQWFIGSDFTQAFGASGLFPGNSSVVNPANATYPTDVAVATLLASGYNQTALSNTPPWDPAVIDQYFNYTLRNDTPTTAWPHSNITGVPVTIAGVTPPLPGPFNGTNDSTLDEFENSLDLEMAGSMAPGAPLYNFYFAGSLLANATTDADIASYFDLDLASALTHNYTTPGNPDVRLGAVSASFGVSDLNDTTWNQELEEAAATGVTVIAASGDQGNAPNTLTGRSDGPWPVWPASAASNTSGAVAVGGISLGFSGTPEGWFNGTNLTVGYDDQLGNLTGVSAWWDTTGGPGQYAGTEGGVSVVYPEPSWQFRSAAQPAIVNATVRQGAGALGRAVPDLAFPANATIAFVERDQFNNTYFTVLEGTSIAAPLFAGFVADEVAVANHRFGFLAPEIYRIASYFAAHPGPTDPFYDVVNGSNYVFSAAPGWDPTTGWGAPLAALFFAADATPAIRNYVYTGPTPVLPTTPPPAAVPWSEIYIIFGVGAVVAILLVIVMARPSRGALPPPPPPYGAAAPPPPGTFPTAAYNGPTFICPYCGALRPAEPVRCPRCGAL